MNAGQFKPGHPKPPNSGRKKGTPNKQSRYITGHITDVVESEIGKLQNHLDRLKLFEPTAYVSALLRLLPYTVQRGGLDDTDDVPETNEPARVTDDGTDQPEQE